MKFWHNLLSKFHFELLRKCQLENEGCLTSDKDHHKIPPELTEKIDQRFEKVDQRFEKVDSEFDKLRAEMNEGFRGLTVQIDRLGSRWGIRNEAMFRATVTSILEKSFGAVVESRDIQGEQFDIIISNSQHILIEIAASVSHNIQERLERKRKIYQDETGINPHRVILAVASIYSRLAESLRQAGFEVIEPEDDKGQGFV